MTVPTRTRWDAVRAKKRNDNIPAAPHTCHARGCQTAVPEKLLMCSRHWAMVPAALKAAVWAEYLPGQEITKTPSSDYLKVAQAAIDAVWAEEQARARREADAGSQGTLL